MRKIAVTLLFLSVVFFPYVSAQNAISQMGIDESYACLTKLIDDKELSAISLQEAIFSMLALGSKSKLEDKIKNEKNPNEECWPSTCSIKETSQVLLAYERVGKNTKQIENWIISKNVSTTNIDWFLQIDIPSKQTSQCKITYDNLTSTINVQENMQLSGSPGSCLSISSSGFWLKVSNNCMDKDFKVSCDKDFVTSLIYQRAGTSTIYVTPTTHSSASLGETIERVSSKCFRTGTTCDYESNLWAALALTKKGIDISFLVPYLLVLADDNQRFLPSAFIYPVTYGEDQYSNLVQSQKQNQFWEAPSSPYKRFYDTALALNALQNAGGAESENAISYLLSVRNNEGCWDNNNIRNTAFLLYAGWPKSVATSTGTSTTEFCTSSSQSYSCSSTIQCNNAGGQVLPSYFCPGIDVCCSVQIQKSSCSAQSGNLCSSSEICSGNVVSSSDSGTCCVGTCQVQQYVENVCEQFGGTCRFSCGFGETQTRDSCPTQGFSCCFPEKKSSSGVVWLIILLIILITLLVLAILYRRKIQLWWFKYRNKSQGNNQQTRPPMPPPNSPPRAIIPPGKYPVYQQRPPQRPIPQRAPPKDKEFEETMKKLRDMNK